MLKIIQDGDQLTVEAPAKINIGLRIVGKRADGFHNLESIAMGINLTDVLQARPLPDDDIRLHIDTSADSDDVRADDTNLVVRAARLLQEQMRETATPGGAAGLRGAEIRLDKRIPVGRGLGGGSSDAAATLVLLNEMWQIGLPRQRLMELGLQLGSDVPLFFHGPLSIMRGRGEIVEPVDQVPELAVLLLVPPFALATASVYRQYSVGRPDLTPFQSPISLWLELLQAGRLEELGRQLVNDLEAPAIVLRPEMSRILLALRRAGAKCCGMTGSGSAVFALAASEEEARHLAADLKIEKAVQRHVLVPWRTVS